MKTKVTLTLDQEVLKEIDYRRGMVNRSSFTNNILKIGLRTQNANKTSPLKNEVTDRPKPQDKPKYY
jgi:hypothetical protein